MTQQQLTDLLYELAKQPHESEWVEFKLNFHSENEIGENISAISNGACLKNQDFGYLVFGVDDKTHQIRGTTFLPKLHKKGSEELEHWLATRLSPKIDFSIYEFDCEDNKHIAIIVIPAAKEQPVEFFHQAYIRVGSYTKKINEYPEKQAKIWKKEQIPFEKEIAKSGLTASEVINLLSSESYFNLLKIPYPSTQEGVIEKLTEEGIVTKKHSHYAITKLGALLFAKDLRQFELLARKAVRVIVYKGNNKVETEREQDSVFGYAIGFAELVNWVNSQLPANEEIGKVLRTESRMYPKIAIRELVANALIHQDLSERGFPMIEIFKDRIEISNPGTPLVTPERFIDAYVSRNEKMADLMRRLGFCEEKGSGMDKVIFSNELYQLPPINIIVAEGRTRITMYSYKALNSLDKNEKIRACYQHTCLKYVSNEKMTNQTLRERFKIDDKNAAIASRIIRDALETGVIKEDTPENKSRKYASYIPVWA